MKILSMKQVCVMVSLSRAEIYRKLDAGNFPKRVQVSENRIGFMEDEVIEWIKSRPRR